MIKSFAEILETAKGSEFHNMAVADASGDAVIGALAEAAEMGIIKPYLVGNIDKIQPLVEKYKLKEFEIIEANDPISIAAKTIALVREGKCDMIMKGKLSTPILMKAVLDKETGLRKGKLLSHVAILEVEKYPKLILLTDAGMIIKPEINDKVQILANAMFVANKLGIDRPKAVGLAAIETVNYKMPETMDAAILTKMSHRKQLGNIDFDGPLAIDVVLSKEAAETKGIKTEMSMEADIFLVPDVASGNILAKGLIYLAGAKIGGVVMGAKAPIVLLSRSDTRDTKLNSIAIGCVIS